MSNNKEIKKHIFTINPDDSRYLRTGTESPERDIMDKRWLNMHENHKMLSFSYFEHMTESGLNINNLDKICEWYGIYGVYLHYQGDKEADNRNSGLYFVMGCAKKYITENLNMPFLINRQRHYPHLFFTMAYTFRISEKDSHSTVERVIRYCQYLKIIEENFGGDRNIPAFIPFVMVERMGLNKAYLKKNADNYLLKDLAPEDRNKILVKEYRNIFEEKDKKAKEKLFYVKAGLLSNTKFGYWTKLKIFFRKNNCLPLNIILDNFDSIEVFSVEKSLESAFEAQLKQYEDIVYAKKECKTKNKFRKLETIKYKHGYKLNSPRFRQEESIDFVFPKQWIDVASYLYSTLKYKAWGGIKLEKVLTDMNGYTAFIIPYQQIDMWNQLCKEYGILYAFDLSAVNNIERGYSIYDMRVVVQNKFQEMAHVILGICLNTEFGTPHEFTNGELNRYNIHAFSYIEELPEGRFRESNYTGFSCPTEDPKAKKITSYYSQEKNVAVEKYKKSNPYARDI